jgi:hypothetical protein
MVIWLASYPRSGNTFFRVLLHRLYGFETNSVYSSASDLARLNDDVRKLMRLIGQVRLEQDIAPLRQDRASHFIKTHDLPSDDSKAVVVIRDGRDAVISFAHFVLKTERGIENAPRDVFESTLEKIITGDSFGGWSRNVEKWIEHAGLESVVRFEDLIADPIPIVAATLDRLGISRERNGTPVPTFEELHASVPWFFRRGKRDTWENEMPPHLLDLFMEHHGETLLRLGYSEPCAMAQKQSLGRPFRAHLPRDTSVPG